MSCELCSLKRNGSTKKYRKEGDGCINSPLEINWKFIDSFHLLPSLGWERLHLLTSSFRAPWLDFPLESSNLEATTAVVKKRGHDDQAESLWFSYSWTDFICILNPSLGCVLNFVLSSLPLTFCTVLLSFSMFEEDHYILVWTHIEMTVDEFLAKTVSLVIVMLFPLRLNSFGFIPRLDQ
jgi:hypothetical protein